MITLSSGQSKISYAYFVAFISILNNMELVKKIYLICSNNHTSREVTRGRIIYIYRFYVFYLIIEF